MLVCVSCNIEFKEDKKFCSYCGGPLVTKEDFVLDKKDLQQEEEKSEEKLICPNCNMIYEFGSSCIQCGSDLVAEISPEGKEEPPPPEPSPEKQNGKSREDLICPACKTIYKNGNFCPKCGSPLFPQMLSKALEEAKATFKHESGEEPVPSQMIKEELIETQRRNLVCPHCKIIYEHGSTCVRCGSALAESQKFETSETPVPPDQCFDPGTSRVTDPVQASEKKVPSPSSLTYPDAGPARDGLPGETEKIGREELELFSGRETDKTPGASKEDPAARSADSHERKPIRRGKSKIDYRRMFLEVGSISIMILAGGYLAWSIYSHVTKSPQTRSSRPEQVSIPARSIVPDSLNATAKVSVPQGSEKEEAGQRSVLKETDGARPSPSGSIPPEPLVLDTLEMAKIKDLLEQIRQANLQKDINLFISCYATDFKDRDAKRKATLSFWKKFDYLELSYDLKKSSITGDTARIKIEWTMKISSKADGQIEESRTFFNAVLRKDEGSWKIQEVGQAG